MLNAKQESILEKVQGILNTTTEKGASEAEAQSAMLLAQKLLAKHGLDMADVEANAGDAETSKEVVEGFGTDAIKLAWWHKTLAGIIGKNFRCFHFYRSGYGGASKIVFLGLKEDVEIAKSVFKFATIQAEHHAKMYRKKRRKELHDQLPKGFDKYDLAELTVFAEANGVDNYVINGIYGRYNVDATRKKMLTTAVKDKLGLTIDGPALRNTYIKGFLAGLDEKFREQKVEMQAEWGLVLVMDNAVVAHHESMKFTTKRASAVSMTNDSKAYGAGKKQGKSFSNVSGELK